MLREVDELFGKLIEQQQFADSRAKNAQFQFADLLRQSVYSRLAAFEYESNAESLEQDPVFRTAVPGRIWERLAAQISTMHRFETRVLGDDFNFNGLVQLNRELVDKAEAQDSARQTILDMQTTNIPVYGEQDRSSHNSHFKSYSYHPLLLFNGHGYCLAAHLRAGSVYGSEGWEEILLPEIERQEKLGREVVFRADNLFAKPEIYEALEAWDVKFAIRVTANDELEQAVSELTSREAGGPGAKVLVEYEGFLSREGNGKIPLRLAASVEYQAEELFPRVGVIATNMALSSRTVANFCNAQSAAAQRIKDCKKVLEMTRLSSQQFRWNEVRLVLSVIAFNLRNLCKCVTQTTQA